MSSSGGRHQHYEVLNLIGYGLAKFNMPFVHALGFKSKTMFYESMVARGLVDTGSIVKNRQDLFDPFFDNGRKGWWQKGDAYIHRKIYIDSLYGDLAVRQYAEIVKMHLGLTLKDDAAAAAAVSPIIKSRFRQMQITGQEAEHYFMQNYRQIERFEDGDLEDARLLGDGYDFQISSGGHYFLAEVKGIKSSSGAIRMTANEYQKAREYKQDYGLVIVSNLMDSPKMTPVFNPVQAFEWEEKRQTHEQVTYHSRFFTR